MIYLHFFFHTLNLIMTEEQSKCRLDFLTVNFYQQAIICNFFHRTASFYTIRLGDHNRFVSEGTEQDITARRVIKHPQYSSRTLDKDIALIQLSRPATLNARVGTVCLPTQDEMVPTSSRCYITGELFRV